MFLRYFFTAIFALQVALSPWLASASRMAMQAQADEDLLLVCTGSSYSWISLAQTAVAGDFVFVDAPEDQPVVDDKHTPTCLLGWLQLDHSLVADAVTFAVTNQSTDLAISVAAAAVASFHSGYSSRAPPVSLIV